MLFLSLFLLVLRKSSVKSQTNYQNGFSMTASASTSASASTATPPPTTEVMEDPPLLQLVAIPMYPVVVGQRVDMHCNSSVVSMHVKWTWHKLENAAWREVGQGRDLTLTKPEESGQYRCHAQNDKHATQLSMSPNHTVYIIPIPETVGEKLGKAAFALSLLDLIILLAGLFYLLWTKVYEGQTTSQIPGSKEGELPPKDSRKTVECDGVYMNYNESYTDLDPFSMAENEYSTLP
ncbi:uncharacterized protein LOC117500822 isoform X2 [Thalassophryne amazonica]|uniref:uncharacterized protein LOC117500822 isoform X2 n=1 Tax=Thalassophryne amazonica TaxID=390379 RepID=UPI0014722E31|nr:uncharacterized protein LOC117500822 isoform X2 [Thalassophryne amazonica]